eukprot:CAMPEP_0175919628 /NCGR_PEP_ID=MMETSP0108-20121206/12497_1 /TAXON_ID=195067 ORGANISM="Goniomonas pacifica, Strain CCMP1869" /NCGR_SAMPLE_ID=MMETSP0108 /ASSEMBLY_ACC=CAM_ASM_000204 /LENGTH=194 /DNA_ID=CAMNT_0017242291 /DNA_START=250 /DNA_END=831 /DNA_ORIENTATION=-
MNNRVSPRRAFFADTLPHNNCNLRLRHNSTITLKVLVVVTEVSLSNCGDLALGFCDFWSHRKHWKADRRRKVVATETRNLDFLLRNLQHPSTPARDQTQAQTRTTRPRNLPRLALVWVPTSSPCAGGAFLARPFPVWVDPLGSGTALLTRLPPPDSRSCFTLSMSWSGWLSSNLGPHPPLTSSSAVSLVERMGV